MTTYTSFTTTMISYKFFLVHRVKYDLRSILAGKQHYIEQIKEKTIINKNNDDDDELRWQ